MAAANNGHNCAHDDLSESTINGIPIQKLVDHSRERIVWRKHQQTAFCAFLARYRKCRATLDIHTALQEEQDEQENDSDTDPESQEHHPDAQLFQLCRDADALDGVCTDPAALPPHFWLALRKRILASLEYTLQRLVSEGRVRQRYDHRRKQDVIDWPDELVAEWTARGGWTGNERSGGEIATERHQQQHRPSRHLQRQHQRQYRPPASPDLVPNITTHRNVDGREDDSALRRLLQEELDDLMREADEADEAARRSQHTAAAGSPGRRLFQTPGVPIFDNRRKGEEQEEGRGTEWQPFSFSHSHRQPSYRSLPSRLRNSPGEPTSRPNLAASPVLPLPSSSSLGLFGGEHADTHDRPAAIQGPPLSLLRPQPRLRDGSSKDNYDKEEALVNNARRERRKRGTATTTTIPIRPTITSIPAASIAAEWPVNSTAEEENTVDCDPVQALDDLVNLVVSAAPELRNSNRNSKENNTTVMPDNHHEPQTAPVLTDIASTAMRGRFDSFQFQAADTRTSPGSHSRASHASLPTPLLPSPVLVQQEEHQSPSRRVDDDSLLIQSHQRFSHPTELIDYAADLGTRRLQRALESGRQQQEQQQTQFTSGSRTYPAAITMTEEEASFIQRTLRYSKRVGNSSEEDADAGTRLLLRRAAGFNVPLR
ncbi:hypothetical protein VPNG_10356 [Cytospora leucostoma]|uniref:Uncharacterized protein n=1 Tax=Cytospora leucostoma TaxID=1230097 RepID=A0A423VBZ5_9PEZI|nr:hypothetical protein VPNG_10356 [Cytospora leucostoma]